MVKILYCVNTQISIPPLPHCMFIQCQIMSILPLRVFLSLLLTVSHPEPCGGGTAVHDTSDAISQNMLEEGLSEHDHITLNTIIYCVTKQQTDNQKFIHERMITFYINDRASRAKKHSADIDENNDFLL